MNFLLSLLSLLLTTQVHAKSVYIKCPAPDPTINVASFELARLFMHKGYMVIFEEQRSVRQQNEDFLIACGLEEQQVVYHFKSSNVSFKVALNGPPVKPDELFEFKKAIEKRIQFNSPAEILALLPKSRSRLQKSPQTDLKPDVKLAEVATEKIVPPMVQQMVPVKPEKLEQEKFAQVTPGALDSWQFFGGFGVTRMLFDGIPRDADPLGFFLSLGLKEINHTTVYHVDFFNQFWIKNNVRVGRSSAWFGGASLQLMSFQEGNIAVRFRGSLGTRRLRLQDSDSSFFVVSPNLSLVFMQFLEIGVRKEILYPSFEVAFAPFIQLAWKY
jgi:hypothetical protein